jgi:hypothetical protein
MGLQSMLRLWIETILCFVQQHYIFHIRGLAFELKIAYE